MSCGTAFIVSEKLLKFAFRERSAFQMQFRKINLRVFIVCKQIVPLNGTRLFNFAFARCANPHIWTDFF